MRVDEVPGACWWWEDYLGSMQADLRDCYGDLRAGKYILRPDDALEP